MDHMNKQESYGDDGMRMIIPDAHTQTVCDPTRGDHVQIAWPCLVVGGTAVMLTQLSSLQANCRCKPLTSPAFIIIAHTSGSSTASSRPKAGHTDATQMFIVDM